MDQDELSYPKRNRGAEAFLSICGWFVVVICAAALYKYIILPMLRW